ncbi:hypothetical protein NDU88_002478 [Pleurodeles waltl]|uniref:Uncharacterized protein n=1 Tax=Pleurodeles waltl TaxID=8319 RepID=A0AAV7NFJ8_PLEWA|nr:hypothetical protein NDU88_002478 [Pleurodeles waltl]
MGSHGPEYFVHFRGRIRSPALEKTAPRMGSMSSLVAQLQQQELALSIPAIKPATGTVLTCLQAIVNEFANFYHSLYSLEMKDDPVRLAAFLDGISIPCRNSDGRT